MTKKISLFILILILWNISAQNQNFYEFRHDYKMGVVDAQGNEVVEPKYDWKLYILNHNSPYFVLMSKAIDPLIVNKKTGKRESIQYITGAYLIDLNKSEYIYIHDGKSGFLMDNKNLEQRIQLPKMYHDVIQEEDYLFGINSNGKADVIAKNNISEILTSVDFASVDAYLDSKLNNIYVVHSAKHTSFFDENFNSLFKTKTRLKDFKKVATFLKTKEIQIKEKTYPIDEATTGPAAEYPHFDIKKTEEQTFLCYISESITSQQNLFTFNPKKFRLGTDRYNNELTFSRNEDNRVFDYISFYIDVKNKQILFPKKYWNSIDLKENSN